MRNEGHEATSRGAESSTQHNDRTAQDDSTAAAMPELPPLNNTAAPADAADAAIQGTEDELKDGAAEEETATSNNSALHASNDAMQSYDVPKNSTVPLPDVEEQLKKAAKHKPTNQHDEKWNQHVKGSFSILASDVSLYSMLPF